MHPLAAIADSRRNRALLVGAVAAVAGTLVLAASWSGPGMTTDSVAYAAGARSFAQTWSVTTITGLPLTQFPPGLPMVLGTLDRLGVGIGQSAVVLGVILVVLTVVATYWLAEEALASPVLALVPTAVVGASTSTVQLFSRMWTEPAFMVLTLLLLLVLTRAIRSGRLTAGTVLIAATAVSLACAFRYVGIVLIPVAALGGVLARRRDGARAMVASALVLGVTSSVGMIAVATRNMSVASHPFSPRLPGQTAVADYIVGTVETLGGYVVPQPLSSLALVAGLPIAALLGYGTWRVWRTRDAGMALTTAFIAVYWLSLLAIGQFTSVEYMRYRIAAPALVPLVILATFAGRALLARLSGTGRAMARAGLVALLVLGLPVALAQSVAYAWLTGRSGHGYNSRAALDSPLLAAVADLPAGARIGTNDLIQLYWTSGRVAATRLVSGGLATGLDYLVLFDDQIPGTTRATVGDPADLGLDMRLVGTFADGRLYRATAA